jgi:hypothetical protein
MTTPVSLPAQLILRFIASPLNRRCRPSLMLPDELPDGLAGGASLVQISGRQLPPLF